MTTAKFAIIYGRTDFFAEDLHGIFVASEKEVRDLATKFIKVIPDDPDVYLEDVKNWDPTKALVIKHSDDDNFLFSCIPIILTTEFSEFEKYTEDFNADY